MRQRRNAWPLIAGTAVIAGLTVAGCAKEQTATAPQVEEKTFSLAPANPTLHVDFLDGHLADAKVVERLEQGTGKVTDAPRLHATLKLKNDASDKTAELIGGRIQYIGSDGKPIELSVDRKDTSFTLSSYQGNYLNPGKEISQDLDVPFPRAALKDRALADVRVDLTYMPVPYRQESANIALSVAH